MLRNQSRKLLSFYLRTNAEYIMNSVTNNPYCNDREMRVIQLKCIQKSVFTKSGVINFTIRIEAFIKLRQCFEDNRDR